MNLARRLIHARDPHILAAMNRSAHIGAISIFVAYDWPSPRKEVDVTKIPRRTMALAVALAAIIFSPAAFAQSANELQEKAKAEGALTFYSGGPAATWETTAKLFEERYPGIKVTLVGGFSNVLDSKITEQLDRGAIEVDVAQLQSAQDFMRWKKRHALAQFKPEGWEKIAPAWKDADGAFVAVRLSAICYGYNSKVLDHADVPKSAPDFLKPMFRGRIITAYPQDDDATLYLFGIITRKYGWGYWKRYMDNQPNFIQGHVGVARSISSGASVATFDTIASLSLPEKAAGEPQEISFSSVDGIPMFAGSMAVFRQAPHPNTARLFLTWYLSVEQQRRLGTWSPRSDVQPANLPPLNSFKHIDNYYAFLSDERKLAALRARFAKIVGPVINKGDVR